MWRCLPDGLGKKNSLQTVFPQVVKSASYLLFHEICMYSAICHIWLSHICIYLLVQLLIFWNGVVHGNLRGTLPNAPPPHKLDLNTLDLHKKISQTMVMNPMVKSNNKSPEKPYPSSRINLFTLLETNNIFASKNKDVWNTHSYFLFEQKTIFSRC